MTQTSNQPLLSARELRASGRHGNIFGPLDLDLYPGDLCVVSGADGSGKSSCLVALSGRFRHTQGTLIINGIDAIAHPHQAKEYTAVARLGSYATLEDRLTIKESITERAYLDSIPLAEAERRAAEIESWFGYAIDRDTEIEQLTPLVRLIASVAIVALRPADVIVVDDADAGIAASQLPHMYSLLHTFAQHDNCAIIISALDDTSVPEGATHIHLSGGRELPIHEIFEVVDEEGN